MVFVAVIVGFCWDSLLLLLLLFLYSVQFRFDGLYLLFHLPSHFARLCIYENIRNIRNLVRVWMNEWMGELSVHLDLAWNFTFCINKIFRGILMVRTIDRTTESIYYEWKTAIAITEYVSFWAGVYMLLTSQPMFSFFHSGSPKHLQRRKMRTHERRMILLRWVFRCCKTFSNGASFEKWLQS